MLQFPDACSFGSLAILTVGLLHSEHRGSAILAQLRRGQIACEHSATRWQTQHSRESFEGEARRTVSPAHRVPSAHSPNLDFLRAVAVLLVLFHLLITTNTRLPDYFGQFGVLLFFVHTSLVLMFSLERIERNKQELFITFYIRRLFRIYPLSIVCVSIIVLFHLPPSALVAVVFP